MSYTNYIKTYFTRHSGKFCEAERIQNLYTYFMKQGFVYIMANDRPTLYTGVTSDLVKRVWQHKNHVVDGFTAKYNLNKLVYFEILTDISTAIIREKQIKDMNRIDKLKMIRKFNSAFKDLYYEILDKPEWQN